MSFPPVPPMIKSIAHVLKVATEHDERNIVVAYWARMHACHSSMVLVPGKKPPEVTALLVALMDWLEKTKAANADVEGIASETVAQALIEEYAMQLFVYADGEDRAENFHKNMIKAFYTAGILMDVLEQFGELSEEMVGKRKYAKWKAAFIHNCLKTGDVPTAGGPGEHLQNVINVHDEDESHSTLIRPGSTSAGFYDADGNGPRDAVFPKVNRVLSVEEPVEMKGAEVAEPGAAQVGAGPNPEVIQKAQKYCKFATSALNYDDVKAAMDNLGKAMNLLKFGDENGA